MRVQAQVACASDALFKNPMLKSVLGCWNVSAGQCQTKCLDLLGRFGMPVNSTNVECTVQEQLMKQYSGAPKLVFNFVTDPASELRKPVPVPAALAGAGGLPSFSFLGEYQRCLYSSGFQYCLLQGSISAGAVSLSSLMGLCRPAECSEAAVHDDVALIAAQAGMANWTLGCRKRTDPDPRIDWTAGQVVALLLYLAIVALVVASTCLDLNKKGPAGPADEPRPAQAVPAAVAAFQAWSLARNWASFVRVRPEDPRAALRVLDGLRVLSTFWVILGHTVLWPMLSVMYENAGMVLPPTGRLTETWFQVVPGGYFAVDTFFLLSGFLGARTLHAKVQKDPRLLTPSGFCLRLYPMALFARWLRLTLIYAFVLLFTQTWYREIGRGALLWNAGSSIGKGVCISSIDSDGCKKHWWAQLLYVNNIWPRDAPNSCMNWSWYLACDMQMFLLVPLFVLMRERLGKGAAWGALLFLNLASVVANIWVISSEKLVSDPVLGNFGGGHFMRDIYTVSWMRVQPYLIGVGLAWVLGALLDGPAAPKQQARELAGAAEAGGGPDQELGALARATGPEPLLGPARSGGRPHGHAVVPAAWAVALQVLSFAAMAFVVFFPVTRYRCDSLQACSHVETAAWSETTNALYGALNHAVWALGLAGLLLLCFLRAPGTWWVNTLLGAEFWQAPMKLTYSAYLIHPLVLVFFYCQSETALPYLDTLLFGNFVSFTVVVFLIAFFLWLLVEKPLENLGTQLLKALTKSRAGES